MALRITHIIFIGIFIICVSGNDVTMTTASGNRCFTCSFTVDKPWMLRECVNNTDVMSIRQYTRPCERYCYTVERFNIRTKEVDSVFRSCREFPKDGCAPEDDFLTCTYSCMGSLCNNISVGTGHEHYCDNNPCSKAITPRSPFYPVIFVVNSLLIVRHYF